MKPLVSIDVFDTAIFREVYKPDDIFRVVENEVKGNFKEIRIEAQNEARKKSIFYTLTDIYKYIPKKFSPKEELKAEYTGCRANPYILNMYNNQEADYIFISDMYLPSNVIAKMLEKCGYRNPQVFVSCEEKSLKGDGSLFRKVEEILGRRISKHVGDNYWADIIGAQRAHIEGQEYVGPPIYSKETVTPELINPKLRMLLINEEWSNTPIEERVGYQFAPLVYSFTKEVLDNARSDQTVFFNARDSFILYIVARWILKTDKKIKYCRFSRKSTHLPNLDFNHHLDHPNNAISLQFFKTLRVQTLNDLLKSYELDKSRDYSEIYKEIGVNGDTRIDFNPRRFQILEKFLKYIEPQIYKKSIRERKNFFKYLSNLGMKDNDIFVDLGHFGSMQSIIKRISGITLIGRYVHTFSKTREFNGVKLEKTSYLPKGFLELYTGIAELIFSEARGTVTNYTDNGVPITSPDSAIRKRITRGILRGIIKGVRDIIDKKIEVPYKDCITILTRFFARPTLEEALFGNRKLFENGSFEHNESITWFDEELIRKGKLKECYSRSYWKSAFKVILEHSKDFKSLRGIIK